MELLKSQNKSHYYSNRPKLNKLHEWLDEIRSDIPQKNYCHLLLKEKEGSREKIIDELAAYFDAAHELARIHIRSLAGKGLHPFDKKAKSDPASGYPEKLHPITLQGYFGEVLAGIIAENYELFGSKSWIVPAFLFHAHDVAFQQLELSKQTGHPAKHIPGQTGEDCLAFELDENGNINRVMFCEAKCTTSHNANLIRENHEKLSLPYMRPVELLRVIEALRYITEASDAQRWVNSLRRFYFDETTLSVRCDLSSYACGQKPKRNKTWISMTDPHPSYGGKRKLTSAEAHLEKIKEIVIEIYSRLGKSS